MEIQERIVDWSESTFPDQSAVGTVFPKFKDEVKEFKDAFEMWKDDPTEETRQQAAWELADIGMMVFQLAEYLETDFLVEVENKLRVNKNRTWTKGKDGTYSHIPKEVTSAGNRS